MSDELAFTSIKPIDAAIQTRVFTDFEHHGLFRLASQNQLDGELSRAYSFLEAQREKWPEDFLVSLGQHEVYLCFYNATHQQISLVTQLLLACLQNAGIGGVLEEP